MTTRTVEVRYHF